MIFATISITFDRNIEHSCCGIDCAYDSMILWLDLEVLWWHGNFYFMIGFVSVVMAW